MAGNGRWGRWPARSRPADVSATLSVDTPAVGSSLLSVDNMRDEPLAVLIQVAGGGEWVHEVPVRTFDWLAEVPHDGEAPVVVWGDNRDEPLVSFNPPER